MGHVDKSQKKDKIESSKGESEKSQSIKLNVILSVPPLFYILYPPLEPFCHPPPFRQKGAFLSYRKLCFHTIKKLRLGCALGAGVDGCRSNRASARECAKAHSFFFTVYSWLPVDRFHARVRICPQGATKRILMFALLCYN